MSVAFLRFDWEAVADAQGIWQHTEYIIELRVNRPSGDGVVASPSWTIRRRYSDFHQCHTAMLSAGIRDVPELPPKEPLLQSLFGSFHSRLQWQEQRRKELLAYAGELLLRPDLQTLECVQKLLALHGPDVHTELEPPTSCRLRPLPFACGAAETHAEKAHVTLDVFVRPPASPVPATGASSNAVAVEILVVFREMTEGEPVVDGEDGVVGLAVQNASGEEVSAIVRIPVVAGTLEASAQVRLMAGRTYLIHASSVNAVGVQSAPITLMAKAPADRDLARTADEVPLVTENGGENGSSDKLTQPQIDRECLKDATPLAAIDDLEFGSPSAAEAEDPSTVVGGDGGLRTEAGETQVFSAGVEDVQSEASQPSSSPLAPRPRCPTDLVHLRPQTFRGRAATEYIAAAMEKVREAYEKTPSQLISSRSPRRASCPCVMGADEEQPDIAPVKRIVRVELQGTQEDAAAGELYTVHREAELLDEERAHEQERRRQKEARAAGVWIAEMTGRQWRHVASQAPPPMASEMPAGDGEEGMDETGEILHGDIAALREMLLSGEALCELVNAAAAWGRRSTTGEVDGSISPVVPMYSRGTISKFKQMENVSKFIRVCREVFLLPEHQLFCTNDLSEGRNMRAVVRCLTALGGRLQVMYPDNAGPRLGIPDRFTSARGSSKT